MRIIAFITFSADIQRYWITSESRRKLPASPRHAGHRCGTSVVRRRRTMAWRLNRTGIRQTNLHPTIPPISALLGDPDNCGGTAAGAGLCLQVAFAAHCGDGGEFLGEIRLVNVGAGALRGPFCSAYLGSGG